MPAKRIIILEKSRGDRVAFQYVLWADVPLPRQPFYAKPGAVSAWKGASAADNSALANGAVTEVSGSISFEPGTAQSAVQADLQQIWTLFQNEITTFNAWNRYGTFWDGTTWVVGGVS